MVHISIADGTINQLITGGGTILYSTNSTIKQIKNIYHGEVLRYFPVWIFLGGFLAVSTVSVGTAHSVPLLMGTGGITIPCQEPR